MVERHTSLISLPDFGDTNDSKQQQPFDSAQNTYITVATDSNFESYLLTQNDEGIYAALNARKTSINDFSTKFQAGKVDLAAAFRRPISLASANKTHKPSGGESVYSATTVRSELQYEPIDSIKTTQPPAFWSRPPSHHRNHSFRETATFGTTNDYASESERYSVESNHSRSLHPTVRRKNRPKSPLANIDESSETVDTDYPQYSQRRWSSVKIQKASRRQPYRGQRSYYSRPRHSQRNGPLIQTMNGIPSSIFPHQLMNNEMHPPGVLPFFNHQAFHYPMPSIQQPGQANQNLALTPIASRSLLTCSREFQSQFPNIYSGLCKGLIDVNRLIQHEVVIPIKEEINLHKNAIRSRRAVIAAISEQLWKPLHGKFPDPAIAPKLVKKVSEYFFDKIEAGIQQAEDERSFLQWMFRFDVQNAIEIRVTTSLGVGYNSAIANIEGAANIKRRKGDCFSLLNPDTVVVDMDIVIKALFLNGGQLTEINNDPMFIDRVQAGENRFAASFINLY